MRDVEERAKRASYMRGWNAQNSDRLRSEHRARYAEDQDFRSTLIRRTRLAELRKRGGVDAGTEEMVSVLQGDPCAYCGQRMIPNERSAGSGAALDHIDPRGDSHWTNLAGACRSCNAVKGGLPLLLSLLERQLRRDLAPIAEQVFLIKGRLSTRRRIDF